MLEHFPIMNIRPATPADYPQIREILLSSFANAGEANLVEQLRKSGEMAISLVAKQDDIVVGHVIFSVMTAPFRALGLGPVAVLESQRKQGIGAQLINAGLAMAKTGGWQGVFVLGNPAYYQRFGFSAAMAEKFTCTYSGPYLMALALDGDKLPKQTGSIEYAPAFSEL